VRPELDGRLVFSFGTNDCASSETGGLPRVARSDAVAHAETILKAASDWLPTLMIGPGGLVGDRDGSHRIVALSADFAGLCARLGVPYFAICELTLGSPLWTHEVEAGDGAHPNSRGYALLAEVIDAWPAWREWVEGRRRS
jgi:hypothetical protein